MPEFLTLDRVRFGYGKRVILHDISMRFERGKVYALIGGSGSGKTTILCCRPRRRYQLISRPTPQHLPVRSMHTLGAVIVPPRLARQAGGFSP